MMMKWKNILSQVAMVSIVATLPSFAFAEDKKPEDTVGNYRVEGIDVVQGRVFSKTMRHEFSALGGLILNNTFLKYEMAQLKYTFHFREGLGFEAMYARAFHQKKGIFNDLRNIPCDQPLYDAPTGGSLITDCGVSLKNQPDPVQNVYFANLVWSPIYGKFAIFSKQIFHFDIYFTGGAGWYDNKNKDQFAFNVGVGTKFFVNEWLAVLFDFRDIIVREEKPFSTIANNRMISVGLSTFFPSHPVRDR